MFVFLENSASIQGLCMSNSSLFQLITSSVELKPKRGVVTTDQRV